MELEQQISWPKKYFSRMTKDQLQILVYLVVEHTNKDINSAPIWWPTNIMYHHPFVGDDNSSFKQVKKELISIIKSFTVYNKDNAWFLEAFRFATRPKIVDKSLAPIMNDSNDLLINNNNNVERKLCTPLSSENIPQEISVQAESAKPIEIVDITNENIATHTQASKRLLPINNKPNKKRKIDEESITLKLSILAKLLPAVTVNVYDVVKYGCPENKDDFLSTLNLMKSNVKDKINGMHIRKLRKNSNLVRQCLPIGFDEEYKNKIAQNSYIRNSPRMVSIVTNQVIPISPLRHNSPRLSFAVSTPTKAIVPDRFEEINNETSFIISDSENDSINISISDSSDSKENKHDSSKRRAVVLQDRGAFSPLVCSDLNSSGRSNIQRKRKIYRRRLLKDPSGAESKSESLIQKQISNYFLPSTKSSDKFLIHKKVDLLKYQCKPCFVKLFPLHEVQQNPLRQRRKSFVTSYHDFLMISDDEDDIEITPTTLSRRSMEFIKPQEIDDEESLTNLEIQHILGTKPFSNYGQKKTISESSIELGTSKKATEECASSPILPVNRTTENDKKTPNSVFQIKARSKISKPRHSLVLDKEDVHQMLKTKPVKKPPIKIKWPAKRLNIHSHRS